jgi:hypothetical protein
MERPKLKTATAIAGPGSSVLSDEYRPLNHKKRRKIDFTARSFQPRGVPALSSWRITRLRLKALT